MRTPAFILALLWTVGPAAAGPDPVRFADVHFRILTTGSRQIQQEVGAFHASLPLGSPGRLTRAVTITNETRGASRKVTLDLTVTPLLGEEGNLHCTVLSDALPEGGSTVSRARDLRFLHPGEQLMELFADPATGTHLILAILATLPEDPSAEGGFRWPRLLFTVKAERWDGADRTILETVQLASEDGLPVNHRYERRVPRWVEPEETSPPDFLDSLPVLDPDAGQATIDPHKGFSILITKPNTATGTDKDSPAPKGGDDKKPKRSLVWVQEWMALTVTPVEMKGGALTLRLDVAGEILDYRLNAPTALGQREETRTARPSEPAPLYLTREDAGGPRGYVLWVVPEW
jgi:hypothetical protein